MLLGTTAPYADEVARICGLRETQQDSNALPALNAEHRARALRTPIQTVSDVASGLSELHRLLTTEAEGEDDEGEIQHIRYRLDFLSRGRAFLEELQQAAQVAERSTVIPALGMTFTETRDRIRQGWKNAQTAEGVQADEIAAMCNRLTDAVLTAEPRTPTDALVQLELLADPDFGMAASADAGETDHVTVQRAYSVLAGLQAVKEPSANEAGDELQGYGVPELSKSGLTPDDVRFLQRFRLMGPESQEAMLDAGNALIALDDAVKLARKAAVTAPRFPAEFAACLRQDADVLDPPQARHPDGLPDLFETYKRQQRTARELTNRDDQSGGDESAETKAAWDAMFHTGDQIRITPATTPAGLLVKLRLLFVDITEDERANDFVMNGAPFDGSTLDDARYQLLWATMSDVEGIAQRADAETPVSKVRNVYPLVADWVAERRRLDEAEKPGHARPVDYSEYNRLCAALISAPANSFTAVALKVAVALGTGALIAENGHGERAAIAAALEEAKAIPDSVERELAEMLAESVMDALGAPKQVLDEEAAFVAAIESLDSRPMPAGPAFVLTDTMAEAGARAAGCSPEDFRRGLAAAIKIREAA